MGSLMRVEIEATCTWRPSCCRHLLADAPPHAAPPGRAGAKQLGRYAALKFPGGVVRGWVPSTAGGRRRGWGVQLQAAATAAAAAGPACMGQAAACGPTHAELTHSGCLQDHVVACTGGMVAMGAVTQVRLAGANSWGCCCLGSPAAGGSCACALPPLAAPLAPLLEPETTTACSCCPPCIPDHH